MTNLQHISCVVKTNCKTVISFISYYKNTSGSGGGGRLTPASSKRTGRWAMHLVSASCSPRQTTRFPSEADGDLRWRIVMSAGSPEGGTDAPSSAPPQLRAQMVVIQEVAERARAGSAPLPLLPLTQPAPPVSSF
jgi:hypothetical protein